jgi:hypothetical protein
MPIINDVFFTEAEKPNIELAGRNFRIGETEIWVSDAHLKKIQYQDRYFTGNSTYKHISSFDKKLNKRVPDRTLVKIEVRLPRTGQVSPAVEFKRKRPLS